MSERIWGITCNGDWVPNWETGDGEYYEFEDFLDAMHTAENDLNIAFSAWRWYPTQQYFGFLDEAKRSYLIRQAV